MLPRWHFPPGLLALLWVTPAAAAAESSGELRFEWEAPPSCPDATAFASAVKARGRTVVSASQGAPPVPTVRLTIVSEADGFVGTMRLTGAAAPREVRGHVCRDVVDALAVVTVAALGPEPSPVAPTPPSASDAPPSTLITTPPKELHVEAGTLKFQRDLTLSLNAGVMSGLVSGAVLPRYDFVLGVDNVLLTPEGRGYQLGPMVRLRASLLGEVTRHYGVGSTHIGGFLVGLEMCGPLHYDRAGLMVLVCPHFAGGQVALRTEVAGVATQAKQAGFGTGGVSLEVAYRFGPVRVNAEAGVGTVIGEMTAEAPDGTQLSKSSVWTAQAMAGVGVTF